jgi:SAM-dependent methyltransferase
MSRSSQQIDSKGKIFHDLIRSRTYRDADEIAITTENHEHLCNILKDISCSFGHNISVLDLGCGTGRYFHCLQNIEKLIGVDISLHMLKEAGNPVRGKDIKLNHIDLICANVFEIEIAPQSFDFIYSIGLFIGYSSFDLYICDKLFDLLKPGGKLFVTVTDIAPRMTYTGLRDMMENSKFTEYEISRNAFTYTLWQGAFYECIAIKDVDTSLIESTNRRPVVLDDSVRSLDVIWRNVYLSTQDIVALIPPGDTFILVDHEVFRSELTTGHQAIPFLEQNGQYWGPPPDDITAIQGLERLRRSGASFIVFAWPAFWWLDYYSGLRHHLQAQCRCVLENERLVIFDLRP